VTAESRKPIDRIVWAGLDRLVEQQDRDKLVRLLEGYSRVLEMVAQSVPLDSVLDELMRVLEEQVDGMSCSVLLLSADGAHLHHGAAPSLPERYSRAVDGLSIGPVAGSCGTAAFLRAPVVVSDIATDPRWAPYKDLALDEGLRACWSTPIFSGRGDLLGTFAMYHRHPFSPSPMHHSLIDIATHVARIAIERDAAERERSHHQEARRLAERLALIMQASKEAICEWDLRSDETHWDGGLAIFGYEPADAQPTQQWWLGHVHPEERERVRRGLERAIDAGQTHWEDEFRFRRKDGSHAEVAAHGLVVRDAARQAVRLVGSLQDITRRKRHEQEMEQLAERLLSATSAATVGTWRLDLRTERFFADASLNRLLGGAEEETVTSFGDAIRGLHPQDRARVLREVDESIATGRPYESDHRVVLPDGEVRWLHSRGRVLRDAEGRPEVMTGAVADITELKHTEQSMAILADASRLLTESLDSERIVSAMTQMAVPGFADGALVHLRDARTGELRLSFAHAADPALLAELRAMRQSGTFRVAAPSRRVLATGKSEIVTRMAPDWVLREDVPENVASLIRRHHISSVICVPLELAGERIGVMVFGTTGSRVYNERDLAFAEELARRASNAMHNAQLFRTAQAERERAEEAAALRERLVAIVGHDLRNPLSAIIMAAQLLAESALPESKLVQRIQDSANRMRRMISQILDFARIRAGRSFDLELQPANLHAICTAVVEELRLSRPGAEITLELEGSGRALCDADRIAQLLSNLIGNALQYRTSGPVEVTVRDTSPACVGIEIHNVGPPIPEGVQATMFDAFRRESSGDHGSQSLGLGLFIAQEVARAHGGSIVVRSPDRGGSTFVVELPRGDFTNWKHGAARHVG
jgi:PAS domain S-box-containing protein